MAKFLETLYHPAVLIITVAFCSIIAIAIWIASKKIPLPKRIVVLFIAVLSIFCLIPAVFCIAQIQDDTNIPFVSDPEILGNWHTVGFVDAIESFNPSTLKQSQFPLKGFSFLEGGHLKGGFMYHEWTKGYALSTQFSIAAKYTIQKISDIDYMFLEWKSGDYSIMHLKPSYYVLTRALKIP